MKKLLFSAPLIFCFANCSKKDADLPHALPPVADFTYVGPAMPNSAISFKNNSVNATTYLWDFGDSTTSEEQNPVHTYKKEGTYSVILLSYGEPGTNIINDVRLKDIKIHQQQR